MVAPEQLDHRMQHLPVIEALSDHCLQRSPLAGLPDDPLAATSRCSSSARSARTRRPGRRLWVTPVPVDHTVPSTGFIVRDSETGFVYTGDTGPTERLWQLAREMGGSRRSSWRPRFQTGSTASPGVGAPDARDAPARDRQDAARHPRLDLPHQAPALPGDRGGAGADRPRHASTSSSRARPTTSILGGFAPTSDCRTASPAWTASIVRTRSEELVRRETPGNRLKMPPVWMKQTGGRAPSDRGGACRRAAERLGGVDGIEHHTFGPGQRDDVGQLRVAHAGAPDALVAIEEVDGLRHLDGEAEAAHRLRDRLARRARGPGPRARRSESPTISAGSPASCLPMRSPAWLPPL